MASSLSTISVFDAHHFRKAHNEQLFYSYARRRKVISEVSFNLEEDEYPEIMEQIALRGWRRLAAPRTDISKLLVQEFYANAAVFDEEAVVQEELPYKSFVRGKGSGFLSKQHKESDEIQEGDSGVHKQITRPKDRIAAVSKGLARVHYSLTCANGEQIGNHNIKGHPNSHIMRGEDIRAEEIIVDNMVTIAQGLASKGNLAHPSTIYKLCKDAGIPLREFIRTPRIPALSYITAKRMETIRFPGNQPQQQQEDEEEDKPMPQPRYESQYHEDLQGIEETLSSMQFFQQTFYENMQKSQADYMDEVKQIKEKQEQIYNHNQRFHSQIWQKQEKLAKEIQEEAYACWAQQQANPNLSEISITQIPDIMRTNVEKGRPLFHGFLKSDYGASSSSQVDPEEPVPLRTAPPSPHFRPPYPPPN
ncbi:hypothetical protein PIB30_061992 [Stylosanthes scabra]|uniref:Putative plant transposon protein domain-containing protein n=1 Tax=Stylosanthes scabra TaxID=79078 RepID=A0ABU6WJ83_9FABA|nr:hypothetical protein [Stylosanthes scabra]